ncbi:MAG: Hpt domain-containing protein [Burkholderiaceae bacterium]|nr:Hpt domain-containing protein [Burkholderiaceae bacterium]
MAANVTDTDIALDDLGPLAWVLDELRKSLDTATHALRRFVRDTDAARGSELAAVDTGPLRIARQHLHQAVGALEMVGLGAPAQVLRAMEAAVQKFVQRPELCTEPGAAKVERAGFALTEYLEGVLLGKPVSPVALFPQYREVQELAGGDRVHPADLWPLVWRWADPPTAAVPALTGDAALRSRIDQAVLKVIKTGDAVAARDLADVGLGLAAAASAAQPRAFWMLCAGFFEAVAQGLCKMDVYAKRVTSRVLLQYASLARGDATVSERLAQDLLFFCAQAVPPRSADSPALSAVRNAWGLAAVKPVNYEVSLYGRFDPALLAQARKRIGAAKETWSALAGGDMGKVKAAGDQLSLVGDSLNRLHPMSAALAQALSDVVTTVAQSGQPPSTTLAMEAATALLYIEAAFEDLDPDDAQLAARTNRLADRLSHARAGAEPEPLEPWVEELYRHVSDRQTMGSVVGELRATLGELEKSLDHFFRNPKDVASLSEAPAQLSQMRGVLSVLGLDQAAQAVQRMRESVEQILVTEVDEERARAAGTFDHLGNNLGALGFLIDMLSYQPALAKKLFVYDEERGELKPLMGRSGHSISDAVAAVTIHQDLLPEDLRAAAAAPDAALTARIDALAASAALADQAGLARTAREAAKALSSGNADAAQAALDQLAGALDAPAEAPGATLGSEPAEEVVEDDLRDIFLDEAREVVRAGLDAVDALALDPGSLSGQTTLRRAFHTLKGSSRMVGLNDFGEAAWTMEQLLNGWLAEQKPVDQDLRALAAQALQAFGQWVESVAAGQSTPWTPEVFQDAAQALRDGTSGVQLGAVPAATAEPVVATEPIAVPDFDFDFELPTTEAVPAVEIDLSAPIEIQDIDFESLSAVTGPAQAGAVAVAIPPQQHAVFMELDKAFADVFGSGPAQPPASEATFAEQELPDLDLSDLDLAEIESGAVDAMPVEGIAPSPAHDEIMPASPVGSELTEAELDHWDADAQADDDEAEIGVPDDNVKVIDSLRIGLPLYNVYLNEADEWSRRLQQELGEWALELKGPVPESAVNLAHSLAGSSATVGFTALSEMARALEQALQHGAHQGTPQQGRAFVDAADDIRRLLHQFAAGFLKEPDAAVLQALRDLPLRAAAPAPAASAPQEMPQERARDVDDDIDAVDAIDVDLFPIFEEEALELLPQLSGALRQWVARPENHSARDEVLRALHTLKGSARLAGAMRLGEMSHRMESEIEHLGAQPLLSAQVEPLLGRFDALQANFDAVRHADRRAQEQALAVAAPAAVSDAGAQAPTAFPPALLPGAAALAPLRSGSRQAVRVRTQLLERLLNQAGEVMITRSRLEAELGQLRGSLGDLTGNLDRLRAQLRDIEVQAESQMQSRLAQARDSAQGFDPLEFDRFTRVQELTRMMAESVNDVATVQRSLQRTVDATEDDLAAQARQTRELQRDLLRTRMVEFDGISERLYRVVRQASKETGKQVKLDITGGAIEMDRGVLDRMMPAFEHILRNCVVHGIEDPVLRARAGKDAAGTIVIELGNEGNDVSVSFGDDGAGLDLQGIRDKAQAQGLIKPGEALDDAAAAGLIFLPGFSTASQVTELAGRGIGMDVVRAEVNALGGRIETTTTPGQGTRFRLVLPLTTAVTQVVMVRVDKMSFGVPAHLVEIVRRAGGRDLQQAYNAGRFEFGGEQVPFYWAGALLQSSSRSSETDSKTLPVVVFRSAAQRVALHVDEVLGNQEVVVKHLGPQLARLPGLAGMTVLASGAVVLIYNPVALATVYGERARSLGTDPAQPHMLGRSALDSPPALMAAPKVPLVMVVDDSITVRRVTQRLLQREGYRVALAADGLQALEQLQQERPAVVLSDIEMPRMDGFDLTRNIRNDERLRDLPIIMITSRIAQKHRDHAFALGVNHYLGKPYSDEELLSLVRRYSKSATVL